jgi:hypothetical protein
VLDEAHREVAPCSRILRGYRHGFAGERKSLGVFVLFSEAPDKFAEGWVASATLAPTTTYCGVVWYLDENLQDAAQFSEREAALAWAECVREMLLARPVS